MKLKGYTNNTFLQDNIVVKESIEFHDLYLDKKNEFNFLSELKKIKQDCLLKPLEFNLTKNKLTSKFEFLSDFKSLEQIDINKDIIDMVIENIMEMHSLNIEKDKVKKFEYVNFLNIFHKNTDKKLKEYDEYIDQIKEYEILFDSLDLVLSHNDLVPGNILISNDKAIFIDYDYVTLNNKFFDIASFITETLNNNEEFIDYFIKKLIKVNVINKDDLDILNKMIKYQDLLWTLWANFMYEKKKEKIFEEIMIEKLNRLKNRKTY
ncbi:phosphotransferase [Spiroplasma sp. BIUS-1]|uniref:phosphotransferase n=1 Tax=Spiroplasma sp. BIUS-1 TaxID=216964 RepID=UPI001396D6E4|nr:phosphotransferase [Spiroplasma sp. BIUS-1]QHX36594.1 choline kinase [Spiroplasma sp. BIUS-1]